MVAFGKATGGGRRDESREAAPLSVVMTTISRSYTAELVDLSATGARVRCGDLPAVGDELNLTVGRIKTFCSVRWTRDDECGVLFYEPLLQDDVITVRREVAQGVGLDPAMREAMSDWVLGIAR
ncbi:MAG: PilZ domain-containing protein [Sphingomicrobium sp.]